MEVTKLNHIETYQNIMEYIKIFNEATREAKIENHKHNLPNVFAINGEMYFELPNKELVKKRPN